LVRDDAADVVGLEDLGVESHRRIVAVRSRLPTLVDASRLASRATEVCGPRPRCRSPPNAAVDTRGHDRNDRTSDWRNSLALEPSRSLHGSPLAPRLVNRRRVRALAAVL